MAERCFCGWQPRSPSPEPAPVTDAEAKEWLADYGGVAEDDMFDQDKWLLRLLADRARYQERIGELEAQATGCPHTCSQCQMWAGMKHISEEDEHDHP